MRLWTIHPKYLDSKGLVALWREGLLALNVLKGNTKGYKNHPQLDRFKKSYDSVQSINSYLFKVYEESIIRDYKFDGSKIQITHSIPKIPVTIGQVKYEYEFLRNKVINRTGDWNYSFFPDFNVWEAEMIVHPLFYVTNGNIESWEKVK